jgi:hypothetical protein
LVKYYGPDRIHDWRAQDKKEIEAGMVYPWQLQDMQLA